MQRHLKFKVWDYFEGCFLEDTDPYNPTEISIGLDGRLIISSRDGFYDLEEKRHEIVRFTGYLDINNVEIYEGDYVRNDPDNIMLKILAEPPGDYTHGEVRFISGGFNVCQYHLGRTLFETFVFCDCCPCALEIVGNRFESKDIIDKIEKEREAINKRVNSLDLSAK
jgi:hypothetical protein